MPTQRASQPRHPVSSKLFGPKGSCCVGGSSSTPFVLKDTVFQGVVLGPPLWNTFFADISVPVRELGFDEVVFADDLNAFKMYNGDTSNDDIVSDLKNEILFEV